MPMIPDTQETEAEEWLEPRRSRLQRARMEPLHSSLGDRGRLCLKKINKKNQIELQTYQSIIYAGKKHNILE